MRAFLLGLVILTLLVQDASSQSASLRGSKSAMKKQNEVANQNDLTRIKDRRQLRDFVEADLLVPIPSNRSVRIDPRLPAARRYTRPYAARFLNNFGSAFRRRFGVPIQVNSAVRTVESQEQLRRRNGNAAAPRGPLASSHLTGATVDISHRNMTARQKAWVRAYLLERERKGWLEATEERAQPVFHIMIFPNYGQEPKKSRTQPRRR